MLCIVSTGYASLGRGGAALVQVGTGDSGTGGDVNIAAGDSREKLKDRGTGGSVYLTTGYSL